MMKEKVKNYFFFSIFIRTIPKMERYCSHGVKIMRFETPYKRGFLVFDVSNAKYLAFDTPDGDALRMFKLVNTFLY